MEVQLRKTSNGKVKGSSQKFGNLEKITCDLDTVNFYRLYYIQLSTYHKMHRPDFTPQMKSTHF